ncbi:MAG: thioesterase family protein [Proteobacteria bacterium]|nr:MAG: thioesterase family protein [Pseudomonadota bacterium]
MTMFSELISSLRRNGGDWTVTIGDDWLQGRTVYGGLAAALCLEAVQREYADLAPLRSAQVAFVGPAKGNVRIKPTLLRKGKSAAFVDVELEGDAGLATRATMCFAADRRSELRHNTIVAPTPKLPERCPDVFIAAPEGLNFVQHVEGRLAGGHPPFSGSIRPEMDLWVRHRDAQAEPSLVSVLTLADAAPPAAAVLAKAPGPISTMTWSLDVLAPHAVSEGSWWLIRTSAEAVADGYSSQLMTVWSAGGTPIMSSRQSLALFL